MDSDSSKLWGEGVVVLRKTYHGCFVCTSDIIYYFVFNFHKTIC